MRSQRFSSGSAPRKTDDSIWSGPRSRPAVITPIAMCVESNVWWPSGDIGFSAADERCMNAIGPRAGSPTGAPASVNAMPFDNGRRQTADACMRKSWGCW